MSGYYEIRFYDSFEIRKGIIRPFKDTLEIKSVYQSITPTESKGKNKTYRPLFDRLKTGRSQDGKLTVTTSPTTLDFEVTAGRQINELSPFTELCRGKRLQTPFISKDGKMLAAVNLETQTTQFFDISGSNCDLKYGIHSNFRIFLRGIFRDGLAHGSVRVNNVR